MVFEGVDAIKAEEEENSNLLDSKLVAKAILLNAHFQALGNTNQRNKCVWSEYLPKMWEGKKVS